MLDYVIFLLEHGSDFSGFAAKAIHAVLLCRMEQGAIKKFSEIEKKERVRRANAKKHTQTQNAAKQPTDKKNKYGLYIFQSGHMCPQQNT